MPESLVTITRHDANFSGDDLLTLIDEINALAWIRQSHKDAHRYLDIIDGEIRRRRITAVHGAFAARRHELLRELASDISPDDWTPGLQTKFAVASLPAPIGLALNWVLQRASEGARSLRVRVRPARPSRG